MLEQIDRHEGEPVRAKDRGRALAGQEARCAHGRHRGEDGVDLGAPSYRFMRRWLERLPAPLTLLRQIDPLIRHRRYRDLIQRKTGDPAANLVEIDHALRKGRPSGMSTSSRPDCVTRDRAARADRSIRRSPRYAPARQGPTSSARRINAQHARDSADRSARILRL